MCHKRADRSFFFRGKKFPICARCTGILVGYFAGIGFIMYSNNSLLYLTLISLIFPVPMMIDGTGQLFGKWVSTNKRRFITGVLGGISIDVFIYLITLIGILIGKHIRSAY